MCARVLCIHVLNLCNLFNGACKINKLTFHFGAVDFFSMKFCVDDDDYYVIMNGCFFVSYKIQIKCANAASHTHTRTQARMEYAENIFRHEHIFI